MTPAHIKLIKHYNITALLAEIAIKLSNGRFVDHYTLLDLRENIRFRKSEVSLNSLRTYIYKLRLVFGKKSILLVHGEGYYMSAETCKQIRKVLNEPV